MSHSDLDLKNDMFLYGSILYNDVSIQICCTTRQTKLLNNWNMS